MGPSVREGATAVVIDGIMYTFGGMGGCVGLGICGVVSCTGGADGTTT